MIRACLLIGSLALALSACGDEPDPAQYGPKPELPKPQRGLLPNMTIPRPESWGNDLPKVPQGYKISGHRHRLADTASDLDPTQW